MRIAQLSTHIGTGLPQTAALIKKYAIDVAGLTEMDMGAEDYVDEIRNLMGPKYTCYAVDKGQHSRELVLVVRKRLTWKTTDVTVTALSDDIPGKGTGNDRWMLEVLRKHRLFQNKRCHLLVHLNAAIQNPETGVIHHQDPKTHANIKSMIKISNRVVTRDAQGYAITLQGDFNVKRMDRVPTFEDWTYLPDNFLHRYLTAISVRLDWILFSKKKFKSTGNTRIIPAGSPENPSDHDALIVEIEHVRG